MLSTHLICLLMEHKLGFADKSRTFLRFFFFSWLVAKLYPTKICVFFFSGAKYERNGPLLHKCFIVPKKGEAFLAVFINIYGVLM
jgi:hypothetical protein